MIGRRQYQRGALTLLAVVFAACDGANSVPTSVRPELQTGQVVAPLHETENAIPGRYIVVLNRGGGGANADATAQQAVAQHGAQVHAVYARVLNGFAATLSPAALDALRRDPNVAYIAEDGMAQIDATQIGAPWNLSRIDQRNIFVASDTFYTYTATGAGVRVYVLDTGIRATHTQFGGRASVGPDFVNDVAPAGTDCNGHGTHVAGTAVGTKYGVAKSANVVGVKVLGCGGSGSFSGIIAGVDWVAANAIHPAVANMSLGGGFYQPVNDAVTAAIATGVPFVISAGNSNVNACTHSPASTPEAITVGSSDISDWRSSFSNWGNCVDIFAPGSNIISAWYQNDTQTNTISGTSMAAPHVAGVAALYLQGAPGASPAAVRDAIVNSGSQNKLANTGLGSPNLLLFSPLTTLAPVGLFETTPEYLLYNFHRMPSGGSTVAADVVLNVEASGSGERKTVATSDDVGTNSFSHLFTQQFGLSNAGSATLDWEATTSQPWLQLNILSGALSPGVSTSLLATVAQSSLALGTHSANVVFTDPAAGASPFNMPVIVNVSEPTTLMAGTPISGISGATNSQKFYTLQIPNGSDRLTVRTTGGTGDVDLYLRLGAAPTVTTFHCAPFQTGNGEICTVDLPPGGFNMWFIMLVGFQAYSGVSLSATVDGIPPAVTNLMTDIASSTQVDLSWMDNSPNEANFQIQRAEQVSGVWGAWGTIGTPAANATTFSDNGVVGGGTYRWRVRPCNTFGCSSWTPTGPLTIPVPPAAPTGVSAMAISGTEIQVDWTDASSNEDEFEIQRRTRNPDGTYTDYAEVGTLPEDSDQFTDTGLAPGDKRQYRVRACNAAGCSAFVTTVLVTIPLVPAAPQSHVAVLFTATSIKLTWLDKSSNEVDFQLERRADHGFGFGDYAEIVRPGAGIKTHTDGSLSGGVIYQYRISACNTSGCSAYAESGAVYVPTGLPPQPSSIDAQPFNTTTIRVNWPDESIEESSFQLQRRTKSGGVFGAYANVTASNLPANTTEYNHTGQTGGVTHQYRIRACNIHGCSAYLTGPEVTIPTAVPAAPTGFTTTVFNSNYIYLSWTDASTDEASFQVQRRQRNPDLTFTTYVEVTPRPGMNATSFDDTTVSAATMYQYRIRSCNVVGCSGFVTGTQETTP